MVACSASFLCCIDLLAICRIGEGCGVMVLEVSQPVSIVLGELS